jgi:hypothetical protein
LEVIRAGLVKETQVTQQEKLGRGATGKPNSTQPGEPAPYPERERADHLRSSTSKSHARVFAAY